MAATERLPEYREMRDGEEARVSRLILECFFEFVAPELPDEGIEEFERFVAPETLRGRRHDHFTLLAEVAGELAGVIEMREHEHVTLLFVPTRFHRRGIARELMERALRRAREQRPGPRHVTVNSSTFAVGVYRRLGFRETGPRQTKNGILFQPMVLALR